MFYIWKGGSYTRKAIIVTSTIPHFLFLSGEVLFMIWLGLDRSRPQCDPGLRVWKWGFFNTCVFLRHSLLFLSACRWCDLCSGCTVGCRSLPARDCQTHWALNWFKTSLCLVVPSSPVSPSFPPDWFQNSLNGTEKCASSRKSYYIQLRALEHR